MAFKYFVVARYSWTDADNVFHQIDSFVVKATSKENALKRFTDIDWRETRANDYGGAYAPVFHSEVVAEFDTKKDAEKYRQEAAG